MDRYLLSLLALQTVGFIVAVFCLVRLYRQVAELKASFAKLGFVVRQDLQQYFDSAGQKIIEVQAQATQNSQQLLQQTMEKVLADAGETMKQSIAQAEQEAQQVILRAHQDRQRILDDARLESDRHLTRLTDYSTEALEWAMEQLVKEKLDLSGHEELIESLVSVYLDEHKRN